MIDTSTGFLLKVWITLILLARSYPPINSRLLVSINRVIIESSIDIVQIVISCNFTDTLARKLHQREVHRHIICTSVKLTLSILEILFINLSKEFCSVCSQMRKSLWRLTIQIIFFFRICVLGSKSIHQITSLFVPKEV